MSGESKNEPAESVTSTEAEIKKSKKRKGVISRLWRAIFRARGDDFEKRLQHISKEEAVVLARITRRSHSWRSTVRHFIMISIVSEAIAVGYAIVTTRSLDLNWHLRALRVLPMFLLPVLFFIFYSAVRSFSRMRDNKDHKTLENLRAERQAKINELKEKTNYYTTQQLIQRYDPDPAAKAAAATVLASKLGADSGLKVYVGDDSNTNPNTGKSNDVELTTTTGLRNRNQPHSKNISTDTGFTDHHEEGMLSPPGFEGMDASHQHPMVVQHHSKSGLNPQDRGWIARLAALLVGEDPTQSYALICGNCYMHNGLARKEDFPFITYYCPHCKALNQPKQADGRLSASNSPTITPSKATLNAAKVVPSEGGFINSHTETTSKLTADAAKVVPNRGGSTKPLTTVTTSKATVDAPEVVPSEGGSADSPTTTSKLTDVGASEVVHTEGGSTGDKASPSSSPVAANAGETSEN